MEILGLVEIPTWLILLACIALLSYIWYRQQYSVFSSQGIDGPTPYPWIGTSLPLFTKGIIKDELDNFKKYGKIYGTYVFGRPTLVVSDDEILKEVLVKKFWDFPNKWTYVSPALYFSLCSDTAAMLNYLKGDDWTRVRNLLTPTFSSGKLRLMVNQINKCATHLTNNVLDRAKSEGGFDAKKTAGCYTMDVMGSTAFGVEMNSLDDPENAFVKNARRLMEFSLFSLKSLLFFFTPFLVPVVKKLNLSSLVDMEVVGFFKQVVVEAISCRKAGDSGKRTDLLQLMLNSHKDISDEKEIQKEAAEYGATYKKSSVKRGLNEQEMTSQGILFLLAGFETSATTLSYMMHTLATHPEVQEKMYEEIMENIQTEENIKYDTVMQLEYLEMFVKEIMRVYTLAPLLNRVCVRDCTIKGIQFKKGQMVGIPVLAIHYDENRWKNPYKFDPERFSPENKLNIGPFDWLPFGYGPRNCIGMRMAMLEAKVAVVNILMKVKLMPCSKTKVPLPFAKSGFHVREGVWISAEPR